MTARRKAQRAGFEFSTPAHFLPNGMLDPAFGTGGKVVDPFSPGVNHNAVALHRLADGRRLAAFGLGIRPSV